MLLALWFSYSWPEPPLGLPPAPFFSAPSRVCEVTPLRFLETFFSLRGSGKQCLKSFWGLNIGASFTWLWFQGYIILTALDLILARRLSVSFSTTCCWPDRLGRKTVQLSKFLIRNIWNYFWKWISSYLVYLPFVLAHL